MENHSGLARMRRPQIAVLALPEIEPKLFDKKKVETAVMLGTRAFTNLEQRPEQLVHSRSYQPITGLAAEMLSERHILPAAAVQQQLPITSA